MAACFAKLANGCRQSRHHQGERPHRSSLDHVTRQNCLQRARAQRKLYPQRPPRNQRIPPVPSSRGRCAFPARCAWRIKNEGPDVPRHPTPLLPRDVPSRPLLQYRQRIKRLSFRVHRDISKVRANRLGLFKRHNWDLVRSSYAEHPCIARQTWTISVASFCHAAFISAKASRWHKPCQATPSSTASPLI